VYGAYGLCGLVTVCACVPSLVTVPVRGLVAVWSRVCLVWSLCAVSGIALV
jgi:hypothetical protein